MRGRATGTVTAAGRGDGLVGRYTGLRWCRTVHVEACVHTRDDSHRDEKLAEMNRGIGRLESRVGGCEFASVHVDAVFNGGRGTTNRGRP